MANDNDNEFEPRLQDCLTPMLLLNNAKISLSQIINKLLFSKNDTCKINCAW